MSLRTALRQRSTRARRLAAAGLVTATAATLGVTGLSGSASAAGSGDPQAIAQEMIGDPAQFECFSNIVERESGWDPTATNAESGAYGLVQALPADKMASAGSDWKTNPATQIEWGLGYMNERYGSPCDAWEFWQANNWY
ncbi:transglycosylase SLT domain-containing protein [Streptomyces sp. 7-21]|jgi:hypothetical protein|uniref:aggregation-promoting factor C-terminal-like domain-containing protein n=1 Tax=Streptomyces sp. 7-21 TaxID=2802283 RepID=UPI00191DA57D|nr:transglycosylase SLT domain-containing protein [Streptomyces sp. 7-21]MBL1069131.1 transglycosylase SLT domain-containing protein [Streptomyces sp. 7-21]